MTNVTRKRAEKHLASVRIYFALSTLRGRSYDRLRSIVLHDAKVRVTTLLGSLSAGRTGKLGGSD